MRFRKKHSGGTCSGKVPPLFLRVSAPVWHQGKMPMAM